MGKRAVRFSLHYAVMRGQQPARSQFGHMLRRLRWVRRWRRAPYTWQKAARLQIPVFSLKPSLTLNPGAAGQIHGESAQPVTPLVMLAGHGGQGGLPMAYRQGSQYRDPAITFLKSLRDTLEHPGAAQVEAIDVGKLGVGAIGHHGRSQPMWAGLRRNARQEARQPAAESRGPLHPAHEVRLGETGRQKILAGGLVVDRTIAVIEVEAARRLVKHAAHLCVTGDTRPVPDQPERECRLVVLADSNRIIKFGQPALKPRSSFRFERAQHSCPLLRLRIIPAAQLRRQLQQPRKAVGPLEGGTIEALQISHLTGNVLRVEAESEFRARPLCK